MLLSVIWFIHMTIAFYDFPQKKRAFQGLFLYCFSVTHFFFLSFFDCILLISPLFTFVFIEISKKQYWHFITFRVCFSMPGYTICTHLFICSNSNADIIWLLKKIYDLSSTMNSENRVLKHMPHKFLFRNENTNKYYEYCS